MDLEYSSLLLQAAERNQWGKHQSFKLDPMDNLLRIAYITNDMQISGPFKKIKLSVTYLGITILGLRISKISHFFLYTLKSEYNSSQQVKTS